MREAISPMKMGESPVDTGIRVEACVGVEAAGGPVCLQNHQTGAPGATKRGVG